MHIMYHWHITPSMEVQSSAVVAFIENSSTLKIQCCLILYQVRMQNRPSFHVVLPHMSLLEASGTGMHPCQAAYCVAS